MSEARVDRERDRRSYERCSQQRRGGGRRLDAAPFEALARLEGVCKTFANGSIALSGVDLDIRRGEFLSLLGPSGCGKSTMLRLLAGLTAPSAARSPGRTEPRTRLRVPGADADALGDRVRQRLAAAAARRASRARAAAPAIEEMLAKVGLSGFEKSYPRELSGGMKMRVSIARALVTRPRVLLMDEPFAALDEITRTKLNDDLVALKCELGATVVFVTHSVYESVYLSDRIVVMAPRPGPRRRGNRGADAAAARRGFPPGARLRRTLPRDLARVARAMDPRRRARGHARVVNHEKLSSNALPTWRC